MPLGAGRVARQHHPHLRAAAHERARRPGHAVRLALVALAHTLQLPGPSFSLRGFRPTVARTPPRWGESVRPRVRQPAERSTPPRSAPGSSVGATWPSSAGTPESTSPRPATSSCSWSRPSATATAGCEGARTRHAPPLRAVARGRLRAGERGGVDRRWPCAREAPPPHGPLPPDTAGDSVPRRQARQRAPQQRRPAAALPLRLRRREVGRRPLLTASTPAALVSRRRPSSRLGRPAPAAGPGHRPAADGKPPCGGSPRRRAHQVD